MGLLEVSSKTDKGYYLYSRDQAERVKEVLALKAQRYSIGEILIKLGK